MKHFTANELVNQALDLANMSNTDFLSPIELDNYINDAYQQIYASVISSGDLYWLQEAVGTQCGSGTGYTEYYLPYDFYSMRKLYTTGGQVISRKSPSASTGLAYDIINNKLRVYGMSNGVRLEYFPNPQRITLPFRSIKLNNVDPLPSSILWPYILQYYNDTAYLIDVEQNNKVEYKAEGVISRAYLGDNVIVLRTKEDDEYIYTVFDFDFNEIGFIPDEMTGIILDERNNILYSTDDGVYTLSGNKVSDILIPASEGVLFRNQENEMAAYINTDGLVVFADNNDEYKTEIKADGSIQWCEGYDSPYAVIVLKDGDIITIEIMPDRTFHYSKTPVDGIKCFGYSNSGVCTYPMKLQDWKTVTTFNYPNNVFYRAVAASLAMSFVMKSGGDPSAIGAQAQAYMQQLSKTLEADATYTRIQNVY